jgi:RAB6A-GEF complex partner protein 2
MHSDIHVAVRFRDQSVFAGEQLRCTITFRNVASLSEESATPSLHNRQRSRRESISQLAAQASRPAGSLNYAQNGRSLSRDHSVDYAGQRKPSPLLNNQEASSSVRPQRPGHKHQRSVSIISVASPTVAGDAGSLASGSWDKPKRGHSRSSTVQLQSGKPCRCGAAESHTYLTQHPNEKRASRTA